MDTNKIIQVATRLRDVSQELAKRAAADKQATLTAQAAEKTAAATAHAGQIDGLVQALEANDWILPQDAAGVREKLAGADGFARTLELFTDMAARPANPAQEARDIGVPAGRVSTKRASYSPAGGRIDYDQTEAGQRFRDAIMGGRH